jgi:polyhydroxyalkanoate synthesis regulator phasin
MAAPGEPEGESMKDFLEKTLLAGLGAVALTKERADDLVDELTKRGRMTGEEAREVVDELTHRWRGDAIRFSERAGSTISGLSRELGLVTRREWEELELRLAQVEHRLRLREGGPASARGVKPVQPLPGAADLPPDPTP